MNFSNTSTYSREFARNVLIKSFSDEERNEYWARATEDFMNPLLAAIIMMMEKMEFREFKDIRIHDIPPTEFDEVLWNCIQDRSSLLIKYSVVSGSPREKAVGGENIPSKRVVVAVTTIYQGFQQTLTFTVDNTDSIREDDAVAGADNGKLVMPVATTAALRKMKTKFHTMVDQPTTNFAVMCPAVLTVQYDRIAL